jgi:hypothetical protein
VRAPEGVGAIWLALRLPQRLELNAREMPVCGTILLDDGMRSGELGLDWTESSIPQLG